MNTYIRGGEEKSRYYTRQIEKLRPIDDDFMRMIMKDNIPLAEKVLQILEDDPTIEIKRACYYLKRTVEGRKYMCEVFEQIRAEGIDEGGTIMLEILSRRKAYPSEPLEITAEAVGCPVEQVRKAVSYKPQGWKKRE